MQAAIAPRGDARTYLLHFTGGGLDDDRYVIQRFVSRSDGNIIATGVKRRNSGVQLWGYYAVFGHM